MELQTVSEAVGDSATTAPAREDSLQRFDVSSLRERWGRPASQSLGARPGLAWIPISALRVDKSYQREVMRAGLTNVFKIARRFN